MRGMVSSMAQFSPENVLRTRLIALGMSADVFAMIAGSNQSRISRALRGIAPFDNQEAEKFLKVAAELRALADTVQPLQLGADPRVISDLLEDFRRHSEHWDRLESVLISLRERVGNDDTQRRMEHVSE